MDAMSEGPVKITVDGVSVSARRDETVLDVCRRLGKDIPTLCHHKALKPYGACRVCLVELASGGARALVPSCQYPVLEGLAVETHSTAVAEGRQVVLELLLARCPGSERIREMAARYGVKSTPYPTDDPKETCILCGLCVRACEEAIRASAVGFAGRGVERLVSVPFNLPSEVCIGCEACLNVCPTGHVVKRLEAAKLVMETWKTELPRARCARCGDPYLPERQIEFLKARIEKDPAVGARHAVPAEVAWCPACRRRATGERFRTATKAQCKLLKQ
jgi:predicted molibdopterin-dependent oxidoreductase YjgC